MATEGKASIELELSAGRIHLPEIDPRAYEHPADRGVLATVRSIKDSVTESTDPLAKVFNEVGDALSDAANKMWRRFNGKSESAAATSDSDSDTAKSDTAGSNATGSDGSTSSD